MPVARSYGLPDDSNAAEARLRMPPLRYGTGYGFAMRAVYAGGRGPSVDEARSLYAPPPNDQTSAQHVRSLAPRRFRRHEGVAPPILLLPSSLVSATHDAMGFEAPGSAELRSLQSSDPEPPNVKAGEPPGPDYIVARARANVRETYRVLVAPIGALDFCGRHGVFDRPNFADLLRGGSPDLNFLAEPTDEDGVFNTGFPVAVVRRNSGFDGDRLIYKREIADTLTLDPDDKLGANVFQWLAQPDNNRPAGQGYLPDPAAEELSLRLRIVGADTYLTGWVGVSLYETGVKKDYPNALPVVLHVTQTGLRSAPATKVADVMSCDNKIYRYNGEDPPSNRAGAKGAKVRLVQILLAPGAQFDLEAACLPGEEALAKKFAVVETIGAQFVEASASNDNLNALKAGLMTEGGGVFDSLLAAVMPAGKSDHSVFSGLAGLATPIDAKLIEVAKQILKCQHERWPLTEIAGGARLRLVHAVNAPAKPPAAAGFRIARPDDDFDAKVAPPKLDDMPGAKKVVLTGEIAIDLDQIDRIEINVSAVEPGGGKFDDPARGRSLLARRAGRWPEVPDGKGKLRPMRKRALFGFDVYPDGKPCLIQQKVTLLTIKHLPDSQSAAYAIANNEDKDVFLGQSGRLTRLDLGALHKRALTANPPTLQTPTAGQPTDEQKAVRQRNVALARPLDISDTKARKLNVEMVGYSRFAGAFDTAPMFSLDGQEHVLHRRQPLRAYEQSLTAKVGPLKPEDDCRATERPAPPSPRTPEIFFDIRRHTEPAGAATAYVYERRCGVRLRFDRGWFSSGEGERLGIVLWPPDYYNQAKEMWEKDVVFTKGREMDLSDLRDEDLGDGGPFVTRWGGDPIRKDATPQLAWLMPPQAFVGLDRGQGDEYFGPGAKSAPRLHDPKYVATAKMPIGDAKGDAPTGAPVENEAAIKSWLDVSLLTFEPYFDIEAEEWFVDVSMSMSRAADPFIRFGLVRYQENAILEALKVSTPVRVWTQLPPRRKAVVTAVKGSDEKGRPTLNVTATVCGVASDGAEPPPSNSAADPTAYETLVRRMQHPRLRMTIVAERGEGEDARRQCELCVVTNDVDHYPPVIEGVFEWTLLAALPEAGVPHGGEARLVAIIEEFDERLPASFEVEPVEIAKAYTQEALVESGPRFLARIPFWGAI